MPARSGGAAAAQRQRAEEQRCQRAAAAQRQRSASAQRSGGAPAQSKILHFLPISKLRSKCAGMHLPQKYIFSGDLFTWTLKFSSAEIYFSATLSL